MMSEQASGTTDFDFWVGTWDLTWGEDGRGQNVISKILDGRIIHESFTVFPTEPQTASLSGISVSAYDETKAIWQQTWVDSQGSYLDFIGTFADGQMILSRKTEIDELPIYQRMVFSDITVNSLDWSWERSADHGKTWKPLWQIHYVRCEK
jgi:hypothetical protein